MQRSEEDTSPIQKWSSVASYCLTMLDDGPTDVALQEYKNKIINTLEEMITDLMNP